MAAPNDKRIVKKEEIGYEMNKMLLSFPTSVNHYLKHYCTRSTRDDPHPLGVSLTEKAKQFKLDTGWEAKAVGMRVAPAGTNVRVTIDVYQGKKQTDIDNLPKLVLDALIGIAYEDDKQVSELIVRRHADKTSPRLEVTVERVV